MLVALWVPTIAVFHSIDTWQLVLNTVTSVFAFLLIALLQNSERRNDRALHEKLDRISSLLAEMAEGADDPRLEDAARDLREGRGLEQRVSAD